MKLFGIDPPLLLLLSPFLNFSGLHPISSPARSSRPTSINSFINAVRIDSVRERGRLGARQQSESSGCTATKVRQESERGRPQNPFQSPEQISFPFSGLSVLPSFLPLLATLFLILFGMPHALCSVFFRQGGTSPFIYSSLGPPAVFVAGSPRSHSDSVTWPQIAISRLPSSLAAPSGPSLLARR